jgi:hypothetical protein
MYIVTHKFNQHVKKNQFYFLKPPRNNVLQRVYYTKKYLNQFVNIKNEHLFFSRTFTGCDIGFLEKR